MNSPIMEFGGFKIDLGKVPIGGYNLYAFGAKGGGADDTAAIIAAITAVPEGGTLLIPDDRFRFTDTLTVSKNINVIGLGVKSCLWADLDASRDAIVVQATGADYRRLMLWKDFAILGGVNSCRRGLSLYQVIRSRFENVHVLLGATEYSIYMQTGWINYFNFFCSVHETTRYQTIQGVRPGEPALGHIRVGTDTASGGVLASVFDCVIEGGVGDLLHIENQATFGSANGENWITGTYEQSNGYAVYAEGCSDLSLFQCHTEATQGIYLKNCGKPGIVKTRWSGTITLDGTVDAVVDQSTGAGLTIMANSFATSIGDIVVGVNGFDNQSTTTISRGTIRDTGNQNLQKQTGNALTDGNNLFDNGDLSRWVGGKPVGWDLPSGFTTYTRTGDGQGDTLRNICPTAVKVTNNNIAPTTLHWLPALKSGRWVTVSYAVYIPAGSTVSKVTLKAYRYTGASSDTIHLNASTIQRDTWVKLSGVFYLEAAYPSFYTQLLGDQTGHFYVGDPEVCYGLAAPSHAWKAPANTTTALVVSGHYVGYGAVAPTTGNWLRGDVVYNATPAAGGKIGWVCVAAGTPGTWKAFGIIDP